MAFGMGMGGGFDSSGIGGLGAGAFGGGSGGASASWQEMPWYSPLIGITKEELDPEAHTTNPQLDSLGRPINAAYNFGPFDTRYAHDPKTGTISGQPTSHSGLSAAKAVADALRDAAANAAKSFNPSAGTLGHGMIQEGHIGAPVTGPDWSLGLTDAQLEQESWSPYGTNWGGYLGAPVTNEQRGNRATIEPIGAWNYIDPRQQAIGKHFGIDNPKGATQEDTDALMNEVLGVDLDVFNLDRAMVSNYAGNPWDSAISPISHSDTMREYESRAAAERALYSQIAQQITQASGQSGGGTPSVGTPSVGTPPVGTPAVGTPPVGTTQPKPKPKPKPKRPARSPREDPIVRHDPIQTLVRAMLAPKNLMRQIAPHARKAIRQGREVDWSTLSDNQADLVTQVLSGPSKPIDYSNPENRGR